MTPLNVTRFIELLKEIQYPEHEIEFLQKGFTQGFDIGYEGPKERQSSSQNIPFSVGNRVDMWNKLMKEVKLKRVPGPFDTVPFDNYIQSPIGLVPKAGSDQTHLIFHLSYDGKRDGLRSVNAFTPRERCTVKYRDLDFAVSAMLRLLRNNKLGSKKGKKTHQ